MVDGRSRSFHEYLQPPYVEGSVESNEDNPGVFGRVPLIVVDPVSAWIVGIGGRLPQMVEDEGEPRDGTPERLVGDLLLDIINSDRALKVFELGSETSILNELRRSLTFGFCIWKNWNNPAPL